jgi:signal peptidase II
MTPERRKYVVFGVLATLMIVADQWTKALARNHLGVASKAVFGHYVTFRLSENSGVAFGMLQRLPGGRIWLTLVALGAFALVIHYLRKTPANLLRLHVALGLVGGGAIGNVLDRLVYGSVTDFLVVDLGFWPLNPWPAFNVADAALVVGVLLMVLDVFSSSKPPATVPAKDS